MPSYALVSGSEVCIFDSQTTGAAPKPVNVGELVVVGIRCAQADFSPTLTDTAGNTYRRILQNANFSYYFSVATAAHANNVYSASAGGSFYGIAAACFTNSDGWNADGDIIRILHARYTGIANPTINQVYTFQDDILLIMGTNSDGSGSAYSPGTGFTEVVEDASNVQQMQFQVLADPVSDQTYGVTRAAVGKQCILIGFANPAGGGGGENNYGVAQ